MDKVLGILNSTTSSEATSDQKVSFGKEIFKYKLIRYLNDKNILARDKRIWRNTKSKYIEFYGDSIIDYNQYCQVSDGSNYRLLADFFINNDIGCIQSLDKPLNTMTAIADKEVDYQLPQFRIPAAQGYDTLNPYMIKSALPLRKNQLYLLPFIIDNRTVVLEVIHRHQDNPIPYPLFHSLMEVYKFEGEVLYDILIKKFLLFSEDEILRSRLMIHANKIKVIASYHSNVLTRLTSLRDYKTSLGRVDIDNPTKIMINNFNIYLAMAFRARRQSVLDWLTNLIAHYKTQPDILLEDELYDIAIANISEIFEPEVKPLDIAQERKKRAIQRKKLYITS